jgi:hypothetical protein
MSTVDIYQCLMEPCPVTDFGDIRAIGIRHREATAQASEMLNH